MKTDPVEFLFRVWMHPEGGDPPEVEVWYHGLEETRTDRRFVSEWASEAMYCEDFRSLFDLDSSKHWQIVGKAVINGGFDYWGEYDEDVTIIEFQKAEVPEDYIAVVSGHQLELESRESNQPEEPVS